jgi:hypothetical protein
MVSAKFSVAGEDGEWFRVRLQEEIHVHGLEGNVLLADRKTLVIVVEGDKSVIKRFHSDVMELCPKGIACGQLAFSIDHPHHGQKNRPDRYGRDPTISQLLDILAEMERRLARIDQNVAKLMAARPQNTQEPATQPPEGGQEMIVKDEAASAFSSMFGD